LQAIYCFDSVNDKEYNSNHLKNTLNLYKTDEEDPEITAEIKIINKKYLELINEFNISKNEKDESDDEPLDDTAKEEVVLLDENLLKNHFSGRIGITRNLNSLRYSADTIGMLSTEAQHDFCDFVVKRMPYILYNDDFNDRPPTRVQINNKKNNSWFSIYNRLFHETNHKYSLTQIVSETDTRRRNAILSDVEEYLNNSLTKAWKEFSVSNKSSINIKLTLEKEQDQETKIDVYYLKIEIVEKIGNKERFFNIIDRSKGFLWYFNFIMKVQFNPKISGTKNSTIYLLDEPGSYLHSAAQEKLCKKLRDISQKHGTVIYCTHSHHLLNPESIPINNIMIAEKDKNKEILLTPIGMIKTKNKKLQALQPVYEALDVSGFDFYKNTDKIICVEGIYDKYAIELMINLTDEYKILPGANADSIIKTIPYLIAYELDFVAIWDNDEEGIACHKKAIKAFGIEYDRKLMILPKIKNKKTRMEEMFENLDFEFIKKRTGFKK
jgi:hypothetical protein